MKELNEVLEIINFVVKQPILNDSVSGMLYSENEEGEKGKIFKYKNVDEAIGFIKGILYIYKQQM